MRNARGLLITLALAAAALLFWQSRVIDPATEPEGFFQTDFYSLLYPMYHYGYEELAAGRLPLWNPFALCGLPFLATLYTGILYPGNFLFFLLPTALAMGMTTAFHTFLTSWFMYLLGREWGWSRSAAAVAAIAWAYSHNSVWFYGPICFLASAAWLPLMALGIERACAGRGRGGAAILAFAGGMSLLAGGFQTFVYGAYALAIFALARLALALRRKGAAAAGKSAAWLLFAALTALAIGAPQVLPTAELSSLTERSIRGLPLEWADNPMEPASPPADAPAAAESGAASASVPAGAGRDALRPMAFGALADLRTLTPRRIPALYFGILPPLLAAAALFGPRWRLSLALSAGGLAALALSRGVDSPLYRIYYELPSGDWFRNANRFSLLAAFAVAVLAGLGLDTLARSGAARRRGLAVAAAAAVLGVALVAASDAPARTVLLSGGAAALGILLAAAATGGPARLRSAAGPALALFLFGELWLAYANPHYHPQKNPEVFSEHAAITDYLRENLGDGRIAIVDNPWGSWSIQRKYGVLNRLRTLNDFEPLVPVRYKLAFSLLENAPPSNVAPFDGSLWLDPVQSSKKALDMLAVRYVLVDGGLHPPWDAGAAEFGLRRVLVPDPAVSIYANAGARPRAALVPAAVPAAGEREAAALIRDSAFDPERLVVVEPPMTEGGGGIGEAALLDADRWRDQAYAAPAAEGSARITRDDPARVEIETVVPDGAPRWLVLMDLPFPGWRARVDSEPAAIRPANIVGRAVALPPGVHRVVFTYASRPFLIGCWLFLAAALAWAVVAIVARGGAPFREAAGRVGPWIVAALLLWALFARTGFDSVREAAGEANLLLLFGASLLCTLPMYALDVLALSRAIGWFNRRVPFADLARVKAAAYIITLVNYNVGTGAIALWLKRRRGIPFLEAAGSILFINVVDLAVLLALLAATVPLIDPPMNRAIGALVAVGGLVLAGHFLYWRGGFDFLILGRLRAWPIFKSFRLGTAGRYLKIAAIRAPFDLLFILNFWLALMAFGVDVSFGLVLAYVPLILFISVVPITVAGLGTVQAATLYLFRDHAPEATLLAFSLMLTVALSAVRALLGLPFFRKVSLEIFSGGIVEPARGRAEESETPSDHST